MVQLTTMMKRFDSQGEKTGWTYIEIPADLVQKLKPGNRKEFKVKGKLDRLAINRISLLPMGGGTFIMPVNAAMRKNLNLSLTAISSNASTMNQELSNFLKHCRDHTSDISANGSIQQRQNQQKQSVLHRR
jgi:hypothetical protein